MGELNCTWKIEDFEAYAFYTGESPRMVTIKGKGTCPQTGFTAELAVVENGKELRVKIVEQIPDFGTFVETETEMAFFTYTSEATEVVIDGVGSIRVGEPTDP